MRDINRSSPLHMDHEGGHNFFIMPPGPLALALRCTRIKNNAKIDWSMMDLIGYKLTTLTHTMREENPSLSKASRHFTVVRVSGAKKKIVSAKALNCSDIFLGHRSGIT